MILGNVKSFADFFQNRNKYVILYCWILVARSHQFANSSYWNTIFRNVWILKLLLTKITFYYPKSNVYSHMVYERIKIATIVLVKWDELKKFFFFFQLCGKECGLSELYQNMCQKNEVTRRGLCGDGQR